MTAQKTLIGNVRGLQGQPGQPGTPGVPGRDAVVDDFLSETSTNAVQNAIVTKKLNEVFQSVSDGKALVASAITDKGVDTDADATFVTIAANIQQVQTGGVISKVLTTKARANTAIVSDSYNISKEG